MSHVGIIKREAVLDAQLHISYSKYNYSRDQGTKP